MTRSQRRRASRAKAYRLRHNPGQFWTTPEHMRQSETRRRHVARLVGPYDPTAVNGRYFDPRESAYSPLTVSHPSLTPSGKRSKTRRTAYTV